jgi:hypothetical protein
LGKGNALSILAMKMERGIDIQKSIETGWLCMPDYLPVWKRILFAMLQSFPFNLLFIANVFLFGITSIHGEKYSMLSLPLILWGLVGIVGNYYSNKLIRIKTGVDSLAAKTALVNYYKKRGDDVKYNGKQVLIVKEYHNMDINGQNYYLYTILIDDNNLYFKTYRNGSRADNPGTITKCFMWYELKKLFKQNQASS